MVSMGNGILSGGSRIVALAILLMPIFPGEAQTSPHPKSTLPSSSSGLGVSDIIRLSRAKVPDSVILDRIHQSETGFHLTTDDLIRLKTAGVSDAVLTAMAGSKDPGSISTENTSPVAQDEGQEASGRWALRERRDSLTDKVTSSARIVLPGDPHGRFEVVASCAMPEQAPGALNTSDPARHKFVALDITPLSKGFAFRRDRETDRSTVRCTYMGVRVGDGPVRQVASSSCVSDTWARLNLVDDLSSQSRVLMDEGNATMQKMTSQLIPGKDSQSQATANAMNQVYKWLMDTTAPVALGMSSAMMVPPVQLKEVLGQSSLRVGLITMNDEQTVIRIPVQDPNFEKIAQNCLPAAISARQAHVEPIPAVATSGVTRVVSNDAPPSASNPANHFVFGTEATLRERIYMGTSEQFISALPQIISKQERQMNAPAADYSQEIARIAEIVRTCVRSRSNTVSAPSSPSGDPFSGCSAGPYNMRNITVEVRQYNRDQDRTLLLSLPKQQLVNDPGFSVEIYFGGLQRDAGYDPGNLFKSYGIVRAHLIN